jgi:hypothetical protein
VLWLLVPAVRPVTVPLQVVPFLVVALLVMVLLLLVVAATAVLWSPVRFRERQPGLPVVSGAWTDRAGMLEVQLEVPGARLVVKDQLVAEDQLEDWLVDWLEDRLVDWLVDWPVDRLGEQEREQEQELAPEQQLHPDR